MFDTKTNPPQWKTKTTTTMDGGLEFKIGDTIVLERTGKRYVLADSGGVFAEIPRDKAVSGKGLVVVGTQQYADGLFWNGELRGYLCYQDMGDGRQVRILKGNPDGSELVFEADTDGECLAYAEKFFKNEVKTNKKKGAKK